MDSYSGFGQASLVFHVDRFRTTANIAMQSKGDVGLRRYLAAWTKPTHNTLIAQAGGMNGFVKFIKEWLGVSTRFDLSKLRELNIPLSRDVRMMLWANKSRSFNQLVDLYRQWRSTKYPSGLHTTKPFWEREENAKRA